MTAWTATQDTDLLHDLADDYAELARLCARVEAPYRQMRAGVQHVLRLARRYPLDATILNDRDALLDWLAGLPADDRIAPAAYVAWEERAERAAFLAQRLALTLQHATAEYERLREQRLEADLAALEPARAAVRKQMAVLAAIP